MSGNLNRAFDDLRLVSTSPPWMYCLLGPVTVAWRPAEMRSGMSWSHGFGAKGAIQSGLPLAPGVTKEQILLVENAVQVWRADAIRRFPEDIVRIKEVLCLICSLKEAQQVEAIMEDAREMDATADFRLSKANDGLPETETETGPWVAGPPSGLEIGDPWTLPVATPPVSTNTAPVLERFLVVIPLPQVERTAIQELEWLRAAVYHELEHVVQHCLRRDYLHMLRAWKSFAEACAVAREQALAPTNPSALDYAHDFRSRLTHGLTGQLSEFGYHLYPFIQWIDLRHSGITDEVWRDQKPRRGYPDPLLLLNEHLVNRATTLDDEWHSFCRRAVYRRRRGLLAPLLERHGGVVPTATIDLTDLSGAFPWVRREGEETWALRLPVSYWGCHVIRFFNEGDRRWIVSAWIDGLPKPETPSVRWGSSKQRGGPCHISPAKRPRDIGFSIGGGCVNRSNLASVDALKGAELVVRLSS